MARLDQVITNIVDVFIEYAAEEGKKGKLNKDELKRVLDEEIQSSEIKGSINPDDIEEVLEKLDKNQDGEVKFREFCRCVCDLAKCHYRKKRGKVCKKKKEQEGEAD